MTDLPPRTTPSTDGRRVPETRYSQSSMWIVLLILAAVIIAAVVFSMNRSGSVVDQTVIEPAADTPAVTETAPATGAGTGTEPAPMPESGETAPATPAPATGDDTTAP